MPPIEDSDSDSNWDADIVILGAGAAGLTAAIRAAERGYGARVLVLEKTKRPGVKILMSGGTRCNVTNARGLHRQELKLLSGPIDPAYDPAQGQGARAIQAAFGPNGKFLGPALRALSVAKTVELFESAGVGLKIEGNGKIFPVSNRATDVLGALTNRLERSGARLRLNAPALGLDPIDGGGFLIRLPDGSIQARKVIIATGGLSYPGSGTTGDGYAMAKRFGHTIVETKPALVPLKVDADWVADLKGLSVPDAEVKVLDEAGAIVSQRREALLFAHFGLTGPAILDVSSQAMRCETPSSLVLSIDYLPDGKEAELDEWLRAECRRGKRGVLGLLPAVLPRRLSETVMQAANVPIDRQSPDLSRDERRRLARTLKDHRLPINGSLGYAKAEVTSGGVALEEVRSETMESLRQPGLFIIGEALDLDGRIGGYNFQAAWSGGWLAGDSV